MLRRRRLRRSTGRGFSRRSQPQVQFAVLRIEPAMELRMARPLQRHVDFGPGLFPEIRPNSPFSVSVVNQNVVGSNTVCGAKRIPNTNSPRFWLTPRHSRARKWPIHGEEPPDGCPDRRADAGDSQSLTWSVHFWLTVRPAGESVGAAHWPGVSGFPPATPSAFPFTSPSSCRAARVSIASTARH
jgi:hypothetical protein